MSKSIPEHELQGLTIYGLHGSHGREGEIVSTIRPCCAAALHRRLFLKDPRIQTGLTSLAPQLISHATAGNAKEP